MLSFLQRICIDFLCWTGFYLRYRITAHGLNRSGRSTLLYLLKFHPDPAQEGIPAYGLGYGPETATINPPTLASSSFATLAPFLPRHSVGRNSTILSMRAATEVEIEVWKVGLGYERTPANVHRYLDECFEKGDAVVWIVDAAVDATEESDYHVRESVAEFDRIVRKHPRVKEVPLLILANKQDLLGAKTPGEIREAFAESLVGWDSNNLAVFPTSVLLGFGVEGGLPPAFDWLNNAVRKMRMHRKPPS